MNAVFERDYVSFSSSWRFLLLRSGFAAGMGLLFLVRIVGAYAEGTGAFTDVGTDLLGMAATLGALLLAFAAPGSFATVLVHARASGGLPVLFSTPLTPMGIAGGAFAARAGQLFLLVLATCPPLALALLFGGIRGIQIIEVLCAASAAVLILGAPAFVVSAWARRTSSAVVTAYLVGTAVLAAAWLLGEWAATSPAGGTTLSTAISPIHAVMRAISTEGRGTGEAPGVFLLFLGSVVCAGLAIVLAAWRLDREAHGTDGPAPVLSRHGCRPLTHENPVLDHELRRGSLLGHRSPARGLLALLLLAEGAYIAGVTQGAIDGQTILAHFALLGFQCLLIVLAVAAAGATALAQEKETNTIELLRAAPLPPSHVVIGKLAGVLRALLPCLVVPLAHLAWGAVIGVFSPFAVPAVAVAGIVVLAAWATFALYQSLDQRAPQRAVARTMTMLGIVGVLLAGNIGWPLISVFPRVTDKFIVWGGALGANPVAAALLPATILRTGGSSSETALVAAPTGAEVTTGVFALLVWLALYVLFGHMLYRRLARLYRTRFEG